MQIRYVITYRETNDFRRQNLLTIVSWLSEFSIPVYIIEQDSSPKLNREELMQKNIYCDYQFIRNDGLFNRAWGINVAHRLLKHYDYMIIGDADILIRKNDFWHFYNLIGKYNIIKPFNKLIDLNEEESRLLNLNSEKQPRKGINIASGIIAISRNAMIEIGGLDERCYGWGVEDAILAYDIENIFNYDRAVLPFYGFHLYHPRTQGDGLPDKHYYEKNKLYLQEHINGTYNLRRIDSKGNKYKHIC